jgi:SAM-dependent methyltransferase
VLTFDLERLEIAPGARVLDLGCGNGRHVLVTRWLPRVTGVALDLALTEALAAVETMQRMDSTEPADGGTVPDAGPWLVVQGDSYRLPFPDSWFDCVIASEVLEHLREDAAALDEMERVLRPGGLLAVSVPRHGPEAVCWALSREYHSNPGGHIRIYRRRELLRKLEEHGLRVVARHHAHALHSPFWWLRCLLGVRNEESPPVRVYHRFLVWEMVRRPWWTRALEGALDPLIGKSLVLYARKAE